MTNNFKGTFKFLKNWFWALPLWKRVLMTSLIGSIGGSTVVGFINKYALYYYAINQNFRLPIEGVEYIDLAVTMLSFAFFLVSILATIVIYSILNFAAKITTKKFVIKNDQGELREGKLYKISIIISFLSIVASATSQIYHGWPSPHELRSDNFSYDINSIYIQIVVVILFILIILFSRKENSRKIFTLTFVFCLMLSISALLFNQKFYKSFLSTIQYGGEIPISIEYRKADNTGSTTNGKLLIRTNSSLTIKSLESNMIEEIPTDRISKIIFLGN